jgi:hypothetical protein
MHHDNAIQVIIANSALRQALAAHLTAAGRTTTTAASMAERMPGPSVVVTTATDCSFKECAAAARDGARIFVLLATSDPGLERGYMSARASACVVMDLHAPSLATIIGPPIARAAAPAADAGAT